jgi:UDP-N-acetylglucosamine--N-acetylmuramyl-(pentapeptide) pyrophosphoryl-undecaprenol N-acetylglucosamine transferase
MATRGPIVLAAGGTGGHVFPAQALAEALDKRGWNLALVTDRRGGAYGGALGRIDTHRINAASPSGGPFGKLSGLAQLGAGLLQARPLLARLAPAVVVGFGGYPSVPTVWAATQARIPTLIHEQNAVMGRANRVLARRASRIATSFAQTDRINPRDTHKVRHTGNPVRAPVAALAAQPYQAPGGTDAAFRVLVTGGSQGAAILSRVVPPAIAALPEASRRRLKVDQQCREEDIDAVRRAYDDAEVDCDIATFFDDMAERLGAAHLLIGRAGASTVAEITAAGRPAILVPYALAADNHQLANARAAEATRGAWVMTEAAFTPDALAERLRAVLAQPTELAAAAARLREAGRPDAARRLADAVEALAGSGHNGSAEGEPDTGREAAA